jgi:hypothetical protein
VTFDTQLLQTSDELRAPVRRSATAGQLLARYLGPIASVVTRKAAQTASDEARFYALLAEKIADGPERKRFMREALRGR